MLLTPVMLCCNSEQMLSLTGQTFVMQHVGLSVRLLMGLHLPCTGIEHTAPPSLLDPPPLPPHAQNFNS